ncbi:adenosine receptor A3-like [Actinia tenebrosa]|uniref:Adenosine receptor A3-like n=1 Tax=Actinia tenebrosa TaxID=6105 RepID=A0A6P8IQZ8_ACTTE|nr:adenosine receptor A3-like [Actinia tenebrosa]
MTSNQTISSFQCLITFDFDPTNTTHLPASVVPKWISLIAINIVISPLTVLINLLVIWTVVKNEQLRSNSYYILVTILSFGDLLIGLVVQPLYAALMICFTVQSSYICELTMAYAVSALLCTAWTTVTMVIVSLERYLYIEHPLFYHTSVTSKKLMIATAVSSVLVGTTILSTWLQVSESIGTRQLPLILTFGPSFVVVFFCVTKIHLTARRQMRAISAQQESVAMKQSKIKECKRTFTLGLIVLASVACLCPILILKIVGVVKGNWPDNVRFLHGISLTLLHLQSLINPIIYSLRLSDIRSGVAKRLGCNRSQ